MAITKQRKSIKTHQTIKNTDEHNFFFFAQMFILFYSEEWALNTKRMRGWKRQCIVHFLFLAALSFVASLLIFSSTSSTGVSSFFSDVLGFLSFCVSVQGVEIPAPIESRLV